jgi:hypothetical protein
MIAVMAAGDPGPDSLFRIRMPDRRIGRSSSGRIDGTPSYSWTSSPAGAPSPRELPRLREWLTRPHVHLALDPEWAMGPACCPAARSAP